ncbi:MAG: hypothetical protein GF418_01310 [Chitinivibrionales bacterium]|nr:hypothetical protein [Chitinivibrionales bacterium]MBD3394240.1 hypothetical protein [Chitinivibrionales bacterium]
MRRSIVRVVAMVVLGQVAVFSQVEPDQDASVSANMAVSYELTHIVNSSYARAGDVTNDNWLDNYFLQTISSYMIVEAKVREKLRMHVKFLGALMFTLPDEASPNGSPVKYVFGNMRGAYLSYAFGEAANPAADLTIGYFPFNYSPETRALGAYLFKSGTYPGYVMSGDGEARLAGIHLATRLPEIIYHDLFFTTEIDIWPVYDMSLSYLARYGVGEVLEINAGAMFYRLLRTYQGYRAYRQTFIGDVVLSDNLEKVAFVEDGDTTWYSKSGVKLMGRACLDINKIVKSSRLGENDLKLYAEAAVLGVKNYTGYYEDIFERIPLMVGFNVPTFGLLDVLAVEGEYYGSPYKNDADPRGAPVPYESHEYEYMLFNEEVIVDSDDPYKTLTDVRAGAGQKAKDDNFRWALWAEKTIKDRFTISAKVASDHLRVLRSDGEYDSHERLFSPTEWYWQLRLFASIF